jgi:large subunit ribosomal protein L4e
MPTVLKAPIRLDIVHFVHYNLNKNRRQAHAVKSNAGMQHSAESWGTGKAVARIPRVSGSGTRRSSQGAFGNMCRKGRMFAPLKIWRRWHRKVNLNEKRHAVASAVAATAVPSLNMARGHRIMEVPEIPLVLDNLNVSKTKELISILNKFGVTDELTRTSSSRKIRQGKGKMRGSTYKIKKGPLIIHNDDDTEIKKAARNIGGLDICNVHRLNILTLAPGGHLGRFVIWTKSAFSALNSIFGTNKVKGIEKKDYTIHRPVMAIPDLARIINSDQVQKAVKPAKKNVKNHDKQKKNALKNKFLMEKLNPFYAVHKKVEQQQEQERQKARDAIRKEKRQFKKVGRSWIGQGK